MKYLIGLLLAGSFVAQTWAEDSPLIEVKAQFIRATQEQVRAALAEVHKDNFSGGTVLMPEMLETMRATLKKSGAETLSDLDVLVQDGQTASTMAVKEIRFPVEYEESKKTPGKFVPTAFESRNAGYVLKATPKLEADRRKIGMRIEPEVTRFLGFVDYSNLKSATSSDGSLVLENLLKAPLSEGGRWHPIFSTLGGHAYFSLSEGQAWFMGGPLMLERPSGQPDFTRQDREEAVYLFITAKVLGRE